MQIYKFGGASIATPDRMKALMPILQSASKPLIMVVSALGKTTNALEKVVEGANIQDFENTEKQIKDLEIQHFEYSKSLGLSDEDYKPLHDKLKSVFDEMRLIVQ